MLGAEDNLGLEGTRTLGTERAKHFSLPTFKRIGLNEGEVGTVYRGTVCTIVSKLLVGTYDPHQCLITRGNIPI